MLSKHKQEKEVAQQASISWLKLVDLEEYGNSWERTAEYFRNVVTKERWQGQLTSFRMPLGKVLNRSVKSWKYRTALPGAPDGQYIVIQYRTSFEQKKRAVETVTPMKEKDGKWSVSGYYIK